VRGHLRHRRRVYGNRRHELASRPAPRPRRDPDAEALGAQSSSGPDRAAPEASWDLTGHPVAPPRPSALLLDPRGGADGGLNPPS